MTKGLLTINMHIQHIIMGLLNRERLTGSTLKFSLSKSENSFPFENASLHLAIWL